MNLISTNLTRSLTLLITCLSVIGCVKETQLTKQDKKVSYLADEQTAQGDTILEIDGARIRVRSSGNPNGQAIVFIHGYSSSLESWDEIIDHLNETDHLYIRYDLLGHGLTGADKLKRYSTEQRVEMLRNVMNALEIKQPVLVGNSLGGQIAWNFALTHPERVEKLILISPAAFSINGVTEEAQPPLPAFEAYLRNPTIASVSYAYGAMFGDPKLVSQKRISSMLDMMTQPGNAQAFVDHIFAFTLPEPDKNLAQIKTSTLIIWGGKDIMIPPDHGGRMHRKMSNSQLKTYPALGHIPHEEAPEIIASEFAQFLTEEN